MCTYFDACKIPIVCQVIHLMDQGKIAGKSFFQFALDIMELTIWNYAHFTEEEVFPIGSYGGYFPPVVANPNKFIQA